MIKRFTKYNHAVLMILLLTTIFACKKENVGNTAPPLINGVTDLINRGTPLQSVKYGEWIVIKGANLATTFKVEFNAVLVADSMYYADDSTVTVKIPTNLPDPINNPITVTTNMVLLLTVSKSCNQHQSLPDSTQKQEQRETW